jgi:plasmid stabilization system protein ParE
MMAPVEFARNAQTDLLEAWLLIAEENLSAADRVLDMIEQAVNVQVTEPLMGRSRPKWEGDPKLRLRLQRSHASAKMMAIAQSGLLALHKLKSTGPQTAIVQHVHVNAGGQAVVGNVQTRTSGA